MPHWGLTQDLSPPDPAASEHSPLYLETIEDSPFTPESIAGLGAETLSRLLLEHMGQDPALRDRIRSVLVQQRPRGRVEEAPLAMIGTGSAIQRVRSTIAKVAYAEAPVLITGESGTGKEVTAVEIHRRSARSQGPFVPINCAALPQHLIASELFGHEKGAFTGADQRRIGRIQTADKGTLFLDEIGDLPLDLQVHLLRFLQENTIDRIGGSAPIKVDARIIAATNVPLRKAVAENRFREDLYFRLNVLTIEMPPLRERGADIDQLVSFFSSRFAREAGKIIEGFSPEAAALLHRHPWPGNIRELIATLRRAVIMADGAWIKADDLALPSEEAEEHGGGALSSARRGTEESLIRKSLEEHRHNIKRTAEHLGVSRVTLYRLLGKYGIKRP